MEFWIGDGVLHWSIELSRAERKKIAKPWAGLCKVREPLVRVGFLTESAAGGTVLRAHAEPTLAH